MAFLKWNFKFISPISIRLSEKCFSFFFVAVFIRYASATEVTTTEATTPEVEKDSEVAETAMIGSMGPFEEAEGEFKTPSSMKLSGLRFWRLPDRVWRASPRVRRPSLWSSARPRTSPTSRRSFGWRLRRRRLPQTRRPRSWRPLFWRSRWPCGCGP